jgi:hypothetical protein
LAKLPQRHKRKSEGANAGVVEKPSLTNQGEGAEDTKRPEGKKQAVDQAPKRVLRSDCIRQETKEALDATEKEKGAPASKPYGRFKTKPCIAGQDDR